MQMGLAKRIIPTICDRHGQLIKGRGFAADRVVGHTRQAMRLYQQRGVDELCYLDIAATREGRGPNLQFVEEMAAESFSPLTVGGGVRSVEDVRNLLNAGADKIAICSHAYRDPYDIIRMVQKFGGQAIVVSIDVRAGRVWTECGQVGHPTTPVRYAEQLAMNGVGEILLTGIDDEGMMEGYNLGLIHDVASAVDVPVIAHGGCGSYADMKLAFEAGASAVAAGALFQFTDCTPQGAAEYLKAQGIEVRLQGEAA